MLAPTTGRYHGPKTLSFHGLSRTILGTHNGKWEIAKLEYIMFLINLNSLTLFISHTLSSSAVQTHVQVTVNLK